MEVETITSFSVLSKPLLVTTSSVEFVSSDGVVDATRCGADKAVVVLVEHSGSILRCTLLPAFAWKPFLICILF